MEQFLQMKRDRMQQDSNSCAFLYV